MPKKIMLLGDSIRLYTEEATRAKLGADFEVYGPRDNGRFAAYTFNALRAYLVECPDPDIIHWNNGLWDCATPYDDGVMTPLDVYLDYLDRIHRMLAKTGATIIFATSTPTRPEKETISVPRSMRHFNTDIERFNRAAAEMLSAKGVLINDLYPVVYPHLYEYINGEDFIHPTEAGVDAISTAVADFIRKIADNM